MKVQPVALHHAPLLHHLYQATPSYFALLGSRVPSLQEVTRDIETALYDSRRHLELLYQGGEAVGSLDYKLNYPYAGDVTINLLLIRGDIQSRGLGERVVRDLEKRLPDSRRLLASVLGDNQRAVKFWERLGFTFATDARPVMTWYAKPLHCQPEPQPAALS
ncbi:GNAT family N-acetyltransferase [Deinococcus psychrotolerans]|uniref:GNAT family N-acetyltransferase n=1 Tax=Deinococcus psychrotolerans TaxID=2489213 RepID=A0A3G8YDD4_9DEIO|nr:GNAT family N-acetyltransferase [Deinococcus psychrotolerans]AZI42923.1 GNAT family N-acetyltransferase [Deinococcus psychrotolerans]